MRRWQSGQLQRTVNPSPYGLRRFESCPAHHMVSPKVKLAEAPKYGPNERGLFAAAPIRKDEVIGIWEGDIYIADKATNLPCDEKACPRDYALQIGPKEYQYTEEVIKYTNHSCEPNTGYNASGAMVAMRDIEEGEEILIDYEMSENSDFTLICKCGNTTCRRNIGAFKNLPQSLKEKYKDYLAPWLRSEVR